MVTRFSFLLDVTLVGPPVLQSTDVTDSSFSAIDRTCISTVDRS